MNTKILSSNLVRVLSILALVIPMAMGAITPAKATQIYTVAAWGHSDYGASTIPAGLTDVIAIAAGESHNLALESDGTVVAWGRNNFGQTDVPPDLAGVVAIDAGQRHSLALKDDGTVVAWGDNSLHQLDIPPGLSDVVGIAAGVWHNLALKSDGTVIAWGDNNYHQIEIPAGLTGVAEVHAGAYDSVVLKIDGTLDGWGANPFGQRSFPPDLSDVVAIDLGGFHTLVVKSDGTVIALGCGLSTDEGQCNVPAGLNDVIAVAGGGYHSLALKSDGTVVGWGWDNYWQTRTPANVTSVIAIAAGATYSLGLYPDPNVPTNTAPTANPGGPYLSAVNTSIAFDGSLSSDPEGDALTFAWDFGDGSTSTEASPTHTYTASGLYDVCLTVSDGSLSSDPACTFAVIYDPSAGFVTGGGWIDSPAGSYIPDPSLSGAATFGFVSRYKKGDTVPSGNTAFQFDLAGMAFSSQSYEWLVVNQAGTNAQFKGSGLVNGGLAPSGDAYKFMLWAGDGSPDTFRIRIWWEDADGEHDLYDNGTAQAIGAGNIVVHTGK